MLERNAFFLARTQGVGVDLARAGAGRRHLRARCCAAPGVNYDIRRAEPYSSYEDFDFRVPVETAGDCYARYRVRMVEFRESIRIIRQVLDGLPGGPDLVAPGREVGGAGADAQGRGLRARRGRRAARSAATSSPTAAPSRTA